MLADTNNRLRMGVEIVEIVEALQRPVGLGVGVGGDEGAFGRWRRLDKPERCGRSRVCIVCRGRGLDALFHVVPSGFCLRQFGRLLRCIAIVLVVLDMSLLASVSQRL